MAEALIENLTEDFDPAAYTDEYRQKVLDAVRAKVEGSEITVVEESGEPAAVVDLLEALRASVESSKRRGGAGAADDGAEAGGKADGEADAPAAAQPKRASRKKAS